MRKIIFTISCVFIVPLTIYGQYYGLPYYYANSDGYQIIGQPTIVDIDTIVNKDGHEYQDTGHYDCEYNIDVLFHYSNSSKRTSFYIEKGKALWI